jgi:ankyrin repeat protein
MSTRSLPRNPNLTQLKLQAKELHDALRERNPSAAARIAGHHPRWKGQSAGTVLAAELALSDAQLTVAREYGFASWPDLKQYVEAVNAIAQYKPHPHFAKALKALDAGDVEGLRRLIADHPDLLHARSELEPPLGYFSGATLLHYVAGNPGRNRRLPKNIVDIARLLLEAGADVDAITINPNGSTTMGLVLTSLQASKMNISGPLIDLLLQHGAQLDLNSISAVIPGWGDQNPVDVAMENGAHRAAEKLIELGATVDVCVAAALGRMNDLRNCFDEQGRLKSLPRRHGKVLAERDAIGLAFLFAYVRGHPQAADFLLEKDGNWNMTGVANGAALHRAAWAGDLDMVKRLVAKGADMSNRDNPFHSTPLSWAQHNKQTRVFDWMVANCRIDLHEAVGNNLRGQAEARLREDRSCVNRLVDHWEVPQNSALHWAAWTHIDDIDGTHDFDEGEKRALVQLLLDAGADPNIVAGDGYTPLDWAIASKAPTIVELLRKHGAKRAAELHPAR